MMSNAPNTVRRAALQPSEFTKAITISAAPSAMCQEKRQTTAHVGWRSPLRSIQTDPSVKAPPAIEMASPFANPAANPVALTKSQRTSPNRCFCRCALG
jgi:hypothetical protein